MARINGYRVTDLGQLRVVTVGPIVSWQGGLPFDANGDLVAQVGTPLPTDPFVGGIRVGELGVYAAQGLAPPWPGGGPLPEFILGPRLSVIGGGAAIPGATLTFEQVCRTPPSYTATKVWWQNDAVLVGPDTSYLIQPSDVGTSIYVSCTATNENGSTTASSNTIFIVAAP